MPPLSRRRLSPVKLLFLLGYLAAQAYAASAVLGIDLGTEYHKAVLVKPGIPLDIVLTKDSKRKEAAALAFKPVSTTSDSSKKIFPERLYGGDALALAGRFPGDVYANLKPLIGSTATQSPAVTQFSKRYPGLQVAACKSGTVCLKSATFAATEDGFSIEELLAMQLQNIRANAESMAGTSVRDVVITVPAFFTVEEKRAITLSAALAGMKVLSLTTDGLAVGLNYATSRTFPSVSEGSKPEYHLVYDMGAGSTTATIMKFQGRAVKDVGKFNKTIQEILVAGTGWDRTLGGDALNSLILEDMITKFADTKQMKDQKVSIDDIKSHGRTIAKLWKDAERMRQVLSANTETQSSFESLYAEDVNFKYKLSRADFEKMAAEFETRVKTPIQQALAAAKLEIEDLNSIILHGGAVRTPFVQKALETLAGKGDRIRTNVNSDEAAAFGAAFRGATISPSFRVKEIWTNETATFPVTMTWTFGGKEKNQKVFVPTSYAGAEKQIPWKSLEDGSFTFSQEVVDATGDKRNIPVSRTTSKNLTASVSELKEKHGCTNEEVTATFDIRLSTLDNTPEVARAYVSCEALEPKKGVVDGVKGLFGFGSKQESEESSSESSTTGKPTSSATTSASESSTETSTGKNTEKSKVAEKAKTPVKRKFVVSVAFESDFISTVQVTTEDLSSIQTRMTAFDTSDKDRRAREDALNVLEGYTYKIRDLLDDEGFISASIDKVRDEIKTKSEAASEWLYGDGTKATTAEFKAKLKELKELVDPISARKDENTRRPDSVSSLRKALEQTKNIITGLKEQSDKAAESIAEAVTSVASKVVPTSSVVDELDELDDEPATPPSDIKEEDPAQLAIVDKEELARIQASFESVQSWLDEKVAAQDKVKPYEKAVLTVGELGSKAQELQMILIEALSKQMQGQGGIPPKPSKDKKTKSSKTKTKSKTKTSSTKKDKATETAEVKEEL